MPEQQFDPALLAQLLMELQGQKQSAALPERPRVGGGPFGLPYLPPLPPRAELRSTNTPMGDRYAKQFDSPQLGKIMSGIDRAGTVGRDFAMAGSDKMDEGARHLAEADDPMKVAGGLGEMVHGGVMMAPGVGPATRLFSTMPRALGTGAAFGLAPMAATGAFSEGGLFSPAEAASLTRQQQRRLDEARERFKIETEAKTEAANKEAETRRANQAADEEAAKQRRLAAARRPWREQNLELASNWPWIVPLSAAGAALGTKALEKFSGYVANRPWWQTVRTAQSGIASNDAQKATPAIAELRQRNASYQPQQAGGSGLPGAVGLSVGGELGMLPLQTDIYNQGFDEAVKNPWELAKVGLNMSMGGMSGLTAGKFGQAAIPGSQAPIEASRALAGQNVRRLLTQSGRSPQPPSPASLPMMPLLPGPGSGAVPSSSQLSALPAGPTPQAPAPSSPTPQLPAPLSLAPRPVGGSHPDHNWNDKVGRWQDVNGRFLSGPAPSRESGRPTHKEDMPIRDDLTPYGRPRR
jgi:hypothetical protein